jgi:MiaB/RimO family radical SAM methylthiotransferase
MALQAVARCQLALRLRPSASSAMSSVAGGRAATKLADGPGLHAFIRDARRHDALPPELESASSQSEMSLPTSSEADRFSAESPMMYFIETYGCQMNVSDSEIVAAMLEGAGYSRSDSIEDADLILTNTCAIRDNAEQRVLKRLEFYKSLKAKAPARRKPVVGVLGCMAERMKTQLLEEDRGVDIVIGPDAYRDLPSLVDVVRGGFAPAAINVQLSLEETYADVKPVRLGSRADAFVSIMRGCNNMCSFCIVPFTRGRERSRTLQSIVDECKRLASDQGVKEIVLLGQNVNSYHDKTTATEVGGGYETAPGFGNTFKARSGDGVRFAELLHRVAQAVPDTRIRFTSPHPKDFPTPLLEVIRDTPNICKAIHLPAQSGSSAVLERMNRHHTRETYLDLVQSIRETIPGVTLSTDMISGFCGETEEDHLLTVDLMRQVRYEQAFLFHYSRREKTLAARSMQDNVPEPVKLRRLQEVIDTFRAIQAEDTVKQIGQRHVVLVEGPARKSSATSRTLQGRSDCNRRVVLPEAIVPSTWSSVFDLPPPLVSPLFGSSVHDLSQGHPQASPIGPGDFVVVDVVDVSGKTLLARPVAKTTISEVDSLAGYQIPSCRV